MCEAWSERLCAYNFYMPTGKLSAQGVTSLACNTFSLALCLRLKLMLHVWW